MPHSDLELHALQRRSVRMLVIGQMLGGVGAGAGVAVISLLAYDLSGTASLSGVSPTASTLGAAMAAMVIARMTVRAGRRPGLVVGYLVGAGGAALAVVAAIVASFPLHVIASLAFGWASASNLQARYAATDLASPDRRASALSTVMWATTLGAVLGPNLTGPGSAVAAGLGLPDLAGPYVFSFVAFSAGAVALQLGLRPDPLVVARGLGRTPGTANALNESPAPVAFPSAASSAVISVVGSTPVPDEGGFAPSGAVGIDPSGAVGVAPSRPAGVAPSGAAGVAPSGAAGVASSGADGDGSLRSAVRTIRAVPAALASFVAIAAAHATMIGVMVMTPVHMETHGASLKLVGLTISLHIAGMYALSPLVGRLADRVGRRSVLLVGIGQLGGAAVLAAAAEPTGSALFQLGFVLLGTGWSCCLVAGSTLLTDVLTPDERPAAQGASDLVMNLAGGVGGTLAGIVLAVASYEALALGALLLLIAPAWLLARLRPSDVASAGTSVSPRGAGATSATDGGAAEDPSDGADTLG